MKELIFLLAALLPLAGVCQPYNPGTIAAASDMFEKYGEPPTLKELARIDQEPQERVLGLFKTEGQAATWLTLLGAASLGYGAFLQGRAAYSIQVHGHGSSWDSYAWTRGTGLSLQLLGAGMYGGGFVYRYRKWKIYKKHPVLFGTAETFVWAVGTHYLSQWGYKSRKPN